MILSRAERNINDHQGQSIAIVVHGRVYLVDAGVGVVRQANVAALKMENLSIAFVTHLHTDHTLGLPDLIFTPWVMGRTTRSNSMAPPELGRWPRAFLKRTSRTSPPA